MPNNKKKHRNYEKTKPHKVRKKKNLRTNEIDNQKKPGVKKSKKNKFSKCLDFSQRIC